MNKLFTILFFIIVFQFYGQSNERFTIKSVSINTENNEFGTVITGEQIVYYLKSNFNSNKQLDEISANLFRGEIVSGNNISKGLKFPTDAIHAVFTNNGNSVYYSKKEGDKLQLFKASVDNTGRWKNTVKLPFNNPKYTFKQPTLNRDNTKLFFVSDKPDSNGGTDIFYVNISNNGLSFSEPIHLDFYINSPGDEIFPFIGENDKLYFSSNGMNGLGGFDIFESFYSNGKYENTANLGEPINSSFDDIGYTLISNNYNGFLASNRTGGSGGFDIYYFSDKKPTLNNCAKSIKGFVRNKETKKPIFEAIVEIFDSKGNNENTLTDAEGAFFISNVECETTYDIVSYKEGFNGFAEVHTSPMDDEIINLYLNPELPEGFKEEFDFSNEISVIETNANKEGKKDIPKVENSNQIVTKKEPVAVVDKDREKVINEAKKIAEDLKKNPEKAIVDNYDPLDYDPQTQPKRIQNNEPKKESESTVEKKEVVAKEWDPLDYDPKTQAKTNPKTNPVEEKKNTEVKKNIAENTDFDPLDYDPHTQYLEDLKKKKDNTKNIEEAKIKREAAEKERQQAIAEAKAYSEQLKKEEEAKAITTVEKVKAEKDATDNALALQNQEKAKLETEKQNNVVAQKMALEKERQQAIVEAKAYSEQLEKEEEAKVIATAEKVKADKEAALEKERQQAIAEAKAYSEQLKKEEEAKVTATAEKAKAEKNATDNAIALQNQEKAKLETAKQNNVVAQKVALEKERQQDIAKAKAYSEQLKKEEDKAIAIDEKAKAEKAAALEKERQQAIAEAKAYSEQLKKEEEAKELVATEKNQVEKIAVENTKVESVNPVKEKYHTVQKGEGLFSIAKNNNLTIEELKAINKLTSNSINVGQKLLVVKPEIKINEDRAIALVENQEKTKLETENQNDIVAQKMALEKERLQAIAEAKAYSEQLKKEEEAKALATAEKANAEKEAAWEKERQQAIAEAKAYSEQLKKEEETKAIAIAEKAKAEKAATLEKERQQAIAEAKSYSEQLKKEEEVKVIATTEKTKIEEIAVEKTKVEPVNPVKEKYHTVQKGDGLYSIAKNNNLTIEELKAINKLTSNSINVGQKLLVVKPETIVKEDRAIAQVENQEKTKLETENQNAVAAQKVALEKERQQAIAEAKVNSEKLKKEKEANASAITEKAIAEKVENIKTVDSEYDEGKSEQENLAAKIEANRILKNQAEEKERLDRIEKAKATALRLKQEKEQNELAETNSVKNKVANSNIDQNIDVDKKTNEPDNGICSKNINGFIKNSITKRNIEDVKIDIYYEGQNIETASTNTSGEFFFYNVDCDTKYTLICYKEGYDNIAKAVLDTKYEQKNITILLEPNNDKAIAANNKSTENKNISSITPKETEANKQVNNQKVLTKDELEMSYEVEPEVIVVPKINEGRIVLNPIYFDLDEYYLTLPARKELDRIILFMKLNPTMIIESGSHTDTQGSFDYNLALSDRRSRETVGYLIANGADPDRISGRGYGETMPINHCLDGVKCSEKEHLQNRRTEFVILKY